MAPLTREQTEDRLRELDNDLKAMRYDFALAAENQVRMSADREAAIALAFKEAEGQPTERRQLALAAVGTLGKEEDATYARMAADLKVIEQRVIIGTSLLKSRRASDGDDPRYRS